MKYVRRIRKIKRKPVDAITDRVITNHPGLYRRFLSRSPLAAIRLKCLDCCGGSWKTVKECTINDCFLNPYRFGKKPKKR